MQPWSNPKSCIALAMHYRLQLFINQGLQKEDDPIQSMEFFTFYSLFANKPKNN